MAKHNYHFLAVGLIAAIWTVELLVTHLVDSQAGAEATTRCAAHSISTHSLHRSIQTIFEIVVLLKCYLYDSERLKVILATVPGKYRDWYSETLSFLTTTIVQDHKDNYQGFQECFYS